MCSRQEVRAEIINALSENNKFRDEQLFKTEDKLLKAIDNLKLSQEKAKNSCETRDNRIKTVESFLNEHTKNNNSDFEEIKNLIKDLKKDINLLRPEVTEITDLKNFLSRGNKVFMWSAKFIITLGAVSAVITGGWHFVKKSLTQ